MPPEINERQSPCGRDNIPPLHKDIVHYFGCMPSKMMSISGWFSAKVSLGQ